MKPKGPPTGLKLANSAKAVAQAFNAALASEGGSIPTWLILNALTGNEWRSQRELARSLGIEGPTLTRHLDGLERAELIRRLPDANDRRIQRLEITDAGRAAQKRMLGAVIQFNRRLQTGLSQEDIDQLFELLDRLVTNVGQRTVEGIRR